MRYSVEAMKTMKTNSAAGLLLLLLAAALSVSVAVGGEHLAVKALETKGSQVRVLVSNSAAQDYTGTVHLKVTTEGGTVTVSKQIRVPALGEATAVFTFASPVTGIVYVGIIEDPDPIP